MPKIESSLQYWEDEGMREYSALSAAPADDFRTNHHASNCQRTGTFISQVLPQAASSSHYRCNHSSLGSLELATCCDGSERRREKVCLG